MRADLAARPPLAHRGEHMIHDAAPCRLRQWRWRGTGSFIKVVGATFHGVLFKWRTAVRPMLYLRSAA